MGRRFGVPVATLGIAHSGVLAVLACAAVGCSSGESNGDNGAEDVDPPARTSGGSASDSAPAPGDSDSTQDDGATAAANSSPLPNDEQIFGSKVQAMYVFRRPYVTIGGSPPVVRSVQNAHSPGTRDVTFENPPLWIADCGRDASGNRYGCARFDGSDDYGEGTGFSIETGDRPSLVAVLKFNNVENLTATAVTLRNPSGVNEFMNLAQARTQSDSNTWRYNGHYVQTPHNIDFGSPDEGLHLHESHLASPNTLAIFDGGIQGRGADAVIRGPISTISLGRGLRNDYAAVDMYEVVVIDQPTVSQASAYRTLRIAEEYPRISL